MEPWIAHRESEAREPAQYRLHGEIGSGGMATIHLGSLAPGAPRSASHVVAIKRLHPQFSKDPDFVAMFLDEARVAQRIVHPNVIRVLDVARQDGELLIVMEYVLGAPLSLLLRRARMAEAPVPPPIAASIVVDLLTGLHAAHQTRDDDGALLDVVHRDVSPQNVLVGLDGIGRVFDFGIAKAAGRSQQSQKGQLKGKLSYIAPEQILEEGVSARTDIYAASVVLWEALAGRRLFRADDDRATLAQVLAGHVPPPSESAGWVPEALDSIVLRGLDRTASHRYGDALSMARAIEEVCPLASHDEVAAWVREHAYGEIQATARLIAELEAAESDDEMPTVGPVSRMRLTAAARAHGRSAASAAPPDPAAPPVQAAVPAYRSPWRRLLLTLATLVTLVEIAALLVCAWLASGRHH